MAGRRRLLPFRMRSKMHRFRFTLPLSVGFLAASSLLSFADAPAFTRDPASVEAGSFSVEPVHTRVLFSVSHMGFSTWYGDFTGAGGSLTLDPKAPAKSAVEIRVPVASVSSTNAKLDGELKSDQWLDAAKFPEIAFKSEKVTPIGKDKADVEGLLTLHGVTRPVTLHATFNGAGVNVLSKKYTVGFDARGRIKRSDFGVKTYLPLIGDEVDLILSAAFEKN
jgi:polyisoprenoid-binding protein YceI